MAAKGQTYIEFDQKYFDQIMRSAGVKALQKEEGEAALSRARSNAPVNTGAYKNGLRLRWVRRRFRDALLVEGTDPKTMLIESKTGNLARSLKGGR